MVDKVQLATCDSPTCPSPTTYYQDSDLDGFGDTHKTVVTCEQPAGYVGQRNDCNDSDAIRRNMTARQASSLARVKSV